MFDSGVGGLSVMQEVYKFNDQALFYYLFDHECFPYGNKSEVFLKKRVSELLKKACDVIEPDLIVIACNTASTIVLPTLRDIFTIPIVGVVPAIKPAAKISHKHHICLLATEGTVHRAYTDFLINEFASDCKVLKIGSQDLVHLAEEQLIKNSQNEVKDDEQDKSDRLKKILAPLLELQEANKPDVVVLGCTHFPLVKDDIAKVLGNGITFIDSGEAVGRRVKSLLQAKGFTQDSQAKLSEGKAYSCQEHNEQSKACQGLTEQSSGKAWPCEACEDKRVGGPKKAFYTGNCELEERQRLEATFKHFGFAEVIAFN